ncbi:unnamed protein product [Paramecium sonneborni]|uniref:Uncharacterized protein n=1 Tax=Paramecium sonneborni TaxID=65129 RepID=A0A8S1LL23_9CILI|nr:unnamed protein product [Paramecium sonneborni]
MFFNFGRFFGFGMQSKLDNLLTKENLTLETILNEDDILQELKMSSSGKFADFIISHPDEFKKMIHYIIDDVQPEEQDIHKYIKYQFIISEVFGSENEKLINYLLYNHIENNQNDIQNSQEDQQTESQQENKQLNYNPLIDDFLKVLQNDTLLVTTAGYINKIIGAIIHRKGHDFWKYLIKNQTVIKNLFKHVELKHISEILEKLLILDTNQEEENNDNNFLIERSALIIRLQKFLTLHSHCNIIISNVCEIFIELYKRVLISLETMQCLLKIMLNIPKPEYFINLAIQTQNSSVYNLLNIQYEFYTKVESLKDENYAFDFKNLYSSLISLLPKALIQQDLFKVAFQTTKGDQLFPLGDAKLSLISLIIQICQRQELTQQITQFIIFQDILDLIIKHSYNNQLQILFDKLITTIVQSNDSHLQNLFFQDQIIFKFLIKYNGVQQRKQKPAYQGILTKITNYLNSNINKSEQLENSINLINKEWQIYIDELNEVNLKELQWMCGVNPRIKEEINLEFSSPFTPEPLISYQAIEKIENSDDNSIIEQVDNQNNDIQFQNNDQINQQDLISNSNETHNNQQEFEQNQENQIAEDITQELNQKHQIQEKESIQEPEPTELIDQNQLSDQNTHKDDYDNQQDLSEPEPQQENKIQQQEPQAEPNIALNVLESNLQQQDEN